MIMSCVAHKTNIPKQEIASQPTTDTVKIANEELKQYVSEEDFLAYQKIKDTLDAYTIEDLKTEKSYDAIKSKISKGKGISVKVIPIWKFV